MKSPLLALNLLLGVLVTTASGGEVLEEYRIGKHTVSTKRLEKAIADRLEEVEKVTILSVKDLELQTMLLFGMSVVASDKQEYKFSTCMLDVLSKTILCEKAEDAVLDEIEIDFEELSPQRRFKRRKR